ncbi:hypothetical protein MKW94_027877 [Papaver nudicaule]|uniref:ubiquitinyl hydrolase 1 n=1 Tax=Papaver nudicaule TaxID=74823 RepID=A0AA41W0U8_PAPNU|nr:hypothetical protein [Papaver nudicaule]
MLTSMDHNSGATSESQGQLTGVYELVSVLTHKGRSADSGHYVAWVKQENGCFRYVYGAAKATSLLLDISEVPPFKRVFFFIISLVHQQDLSFSPSPAFIPYMLLSVSSSAIPIFSCHEEEPLSRLSGTCLLQFWVPLKH